MHHQTALETCLVETKYGRWEYYRCPAARFFTKCFLTCGTDRLEHYLQTIGRTLHDCYSHINLDKMRCFCGKSLVLAMSQSEKNPSRLFFKCCKRMCNFFQWGDQWPKGKVRDYLEPGSHTHPSREVEGYPLQGRWSGHPLPTRHDDQRRTPARTRHPLRPRLVGWMLKPTILYERRYQCHGVPTWTAREDFWPSKGKRITSRFVCITCPC